MELACFDLTYGVLNEFAEFAALLFRNRGFQVLNLRHSLSNKRNERNI